MEEKISNIIHYQFSHIYCHNCRNNGNDDACEDCNRKSMKWKVSKEFSDAVAKLIVEEVKQPITLREALEAVLKTKFVGGLTWEQNVLSKIKDVLIECNVNDDDIECIAAEAEALCQKK